MQADLIVYALIAAGLVFWLRSILGTRHGDERQRGNPLVAQEIKGGTDHFNPHAAQERALSAEERVAQMAAQKGERLSIESKAAEGGLIEIARVDPEFDIGFFLTAAQDAFAMIVESFAAGDREALKDFLGEPVYAAFDAAMAEREKRGEKQETQIRAIRRAEITEAGLRGKAASVTVRFTADEVSVTRDSLGNIIEGHPEKASLMRDIWVFSRDLRSRDPRWLVAETRSGFEGDSDSVPNTH